MQERYYTDDKNTQILLSLLKAHGIKKVIASPGTTNIALVASMMIDPWFEMYSSVDERSACYMACGMASESGEPVVLSCTGATASRNYFPGLTEAYYRKLPILAITGSHGEDSLGHLHAQSMDRTQAPKDTVVFSSSVKIKDTQWKATIEINKAILALSYKGGGPSHLNLESAAYGTFNTKKLPAVRKISRYTIDDKLPILNAERVAIIIGSHKNFSDEETKYIESFCQSNNGVVLCDHTSGYNGQYKVLSALPTSQKYLPQDFLQPDVVIHIGNVSGEFYVKKKVKGKETWRINIDGEVRDLFGNLSAVFEMSEKSFFKYYSQGETTNTEYYEYFNSLYKKLLTSIPNLPFGNLWIAQQLHNNLPQNSCIHVSIFNSLRSWNFFEIDASINSQCNVGGFGIDGPVSTLIGSSLVDKEKLHFLITGDLAFFYDMNALGNRHIGKNIRILLVNNGRGTEFRNSDHPASNWGDSADLFMAAGGHFGSQSRALVKHYSTDLGFTYLAASTKEEFEANMDTFLNKESKNSMLFEVFTTSENESDAIRLIKNILPDCRSNLDKIKDNSREIAKKVVGNFRNKLR